MLSFFYHLVISPLIYIFEIIFVVMYRIFHDAGRGNGIGPAIIALSVIVSTLLLPLYRQADALQEKERDIQARMEYWIGHLKRTFKGDEQYMMLSAYYREMHYHPLYSLRSSLSLLLQIPFFIAAYQFLSHLLLLQEASFGPIGDLGAPDGLLTIAGVSVNVLPIAMTLINLVSGAIYSRGFPLKMKVQQYALTVLFLVLLYNRPAGLVLYWTMNNVYSLGKNIITKVSKHPRRDSALIAALLGVAFLLLGRPGISNRKRMVIAAVMVVLAFMPLLSLIEQRLLGGVFDKGRIAFLRLLDWISPDGKRARLVVWLSGALLALTAGYLIPMSIISPAPEEFIEPSAYVTPLRIVVYTLPRAAGMFLLWGNVIFSLLRERGKRVFAALIWGASILALLNYMFFSKNFGSITTECVLDKTVTFGEKELLTNLGFLFLITLVLVLIRRKLQSFIPHICCVFILGTVVLCGSDTMKMQAAINEMEDLVPAARSTQEAASSQESAAEFEPLYSLSRTGKNVIVIMMDRMISGYLPYMLKERPELAEQFSGFTWYPNTLSFGGHTNYGAPALFGGYEYTPVEMNKRDTELLQVKHDEALKVMPVLFLNAGYKVTVCDPPLAGYKWIPKLSIYDDYPEIQTYNTLYKKEYRQDIEEEMEALYGATSEKLQYHNFFSYSIFRMVPNAMQSTLYDTGHYFNTITNASLGDKFMRSYGALSHLKDMVEFTDDSQNTFLMMENKLPHEDTLLQMPDYEPVPYVNNNPYFDPDIFTIDGVTCTMKTETHFSHYAVNIASMLKLGEWLDYLKENGVYDNTRIIIVADHGHKEQQLKSLISDKCDFMRMNPMLLVKDFDAQGDLETDNTFMTNADTPVLATNELIDNPVNPFTGNPITSDEKTAHPQLVTTSSNFSIKNNNGTTYNTSDGVWYSVEENIFDGSKRILYQSAEDAIRAWDSIK